MKCHSCPRYRTCSGTRSKDVESIDFDGLQELFFHEVTMTDSVLSFV